MTTTGSAPELILDGLVFPEGPRWHGGRLWFSDMYGHRVLALSESGAVETICDVPGRPSGLGWLPDGRLLVVSMKDRAVLRLDPAGLTLHAGLAPLTESMVNDMVVDHAGRAYVGSFGAGYAPGQPLPPAEIFLIQSDGRASVAAGGLTFPNGMVILDGGQTLVVAETFANRLTAFDIGRNGALSNRRTWAELGDHEPDGICLDASGAIWCASLRGEGYIRVAEGGEILESVSLAGKQTVACALGGGDGRTLFMLAATIDDENRRAGFVYRTRVSNPGIS